MRFDLSKYSTVAERLAQFHKDYPDGRIVTEWANDYAEQTDKFRWVIKTTIYLSAGDQANNLAKSTGYAFEIDGTGGANQTSALENAESSSIGRALMVMGYSMNKEPNSLASREEMQKVVKGSHRDWEALANETDDKDELRKLYAEAQRNNASAKTLEYIKDKAIGTHGTSSISSRTEGSVRAGDGDAVDGSVSQPSRPGKVQK